MYERIAAERHGMHSHVYDPPTARRVGSVGTSLKPSPVSGGKQELISCTLSLSRRLIVQI